MPEDLLPKKALCDMGGVTGRKARIIKIKNEKGKDGRASVRRGSDLKIIPMGFREARNVLKRSEYRSINLTVNANPILILSRI